MVWKVKGHGEGKAEEGAEGVVHHGEQLLQAGGEVVPAPGEEDDAAPLDPDPRELPPDHRGKGGKVEETGVRADWRMEEVGQSPLRPDQGITIHHPR